MEMNGVLTSSKTDEWLTPPEIIDAVLRVMGSITLDPCSNEGMNVPALSHYMEGGLEKNWFGKVFVNPPYGRQIGKWIDKALSEYEREDQFGFDVEEIILLLPARIDTKWFQKLENELWCAVSGRLKFSGHKNSAPFPSAVVYIGDDWRRFANVFSDFGICYAQFPML